MSKIKKRADGRYVKTITDPRTGQRYFFYGRTEREINRKILDHTIKQENGELFKSVSDEWWEEAYDNLAYQSTKSYIAAKKRADACFGDHNVKEIKPKDITLFLRKLSNQGFAQRTIANQKLVINQIMNYAVLQNLIETNPCASAKMPKEVKKTARSAASVSDESIIRKTTDVWLFPYIAIMTGMRKGEILALQWKDIDFKNNLIYVTKSIYHKGDQPQVKKPKTKAGERTVPLLLPLRERLLSFESRPEEDYIISDDGKKPLTNRRYTTLWNKFKAETGVNCTAHQLRHSFATIAFECNVPIKSVQEILGHQQISTTMDLYTEFRKKSFDDASQVLNEFMQKN